MDAPFGDGAGKLAGLHRLLEQHGEAVEADLERYYRRDLAEFFTGGLSARKLLVLVRHLPHDSATVQAMVQDGADWTRDTVLLAGIFRALAGEPHPLERQITAVSVGNRNADRLLAQRQRLQGG